MRHWKQIFHIATQEASWEFARSSGPGGQNVNKVESKAVIRWNLEHSYLTPEEKDFVRENLAHQLSKAQEIVIGSDRFRDRERNRSDVIEKLYHLFEKSFFKPPARKKTKPPKSAKKKRLESKARRKELKSSRRKVDY